MGDDNDAESHEKWNGDGATEPTQSHAHVSNTGLLIEKGRPQNGADHDCHDENQPRGKMSDADTSDLNAVRVEGA